MPWWRRADPETSRKPSDIETRLDRAFDDLDRVTEKAHRVATMLADQAEKERAGGDRN